MILASKILFLVDMAITASFYRFKLLSNLESMDSNYIITLYIDKHIGLKNNWCQLLLLQIEKGLRFVKESEICSVPFDFFI